MCPAVAFSALSVASIAALKALVVDLAAAAFAPVAGAPGPGPVAAPVAGATTPAPVAAGAPAGALNKGVEVPASTPLIGVVVPVTIRERNNARDDESEVSVSVEAPDAGPEGASRARIAGSTKPGPMAMSSISMRAVSAT